jgi:endoglucanase
MFIPHFAKAKSTAIFFLAIVSAPFAAKFNSLQIQDKDYLVIHILDGQVEHRDDGLGASAFGGHSHDSDGDIVTQFEPHLNTTAAQQCSQYTITSSTDANYGATGKQPVQCYRKTRMNGHAERAWSTAINDYQYEYTYEHYLYLQLPSSLQDSQNYGLQIGGQTNIDQTNHAFTFDIFQSVSEAVHVNLVGYNTDNSVKSADLYAWMGDGGARDYSELEGNKVYLYNTTTQTSTEVGEVRFWKNSGNDHGHYNLTRSNVWNVDFTGFNTPGTYRLAVQGVGCSPDFVIDANAYFEPFKVSTLGFFYMRIGQDSVGGIWPVPRRPLYIPNVSPSNTKVYLTTMHPYHSQWGSFSNGDVWDKPDSWKSFMKAGNPTNPNAKGGHSDALDWDRHLGHVSIIYDMLLPFILSDGAINDDDLGIAESGNGIPDIIDEARNEVDFWLSLRDGAGYSHGLTNPNKQNELFQAAPTAVAAWANAANAAMLAQALSLANLPALSAQYLDSATIAYNHALSLSDQMLSNTQGIGESVMSGKDFKMTAAAWLYTLTGDTQYEDDVQSLSVVTNGTSVIDNYGGSKNTNQVYAMAAYLTTHQPINYPTLHENMKLSMIHQAKEQEANNTLSRPSRRGADKHTGYFKTIQNMHRTIVAHKITQNQSDKDFFLDALVLEADYGLGRNPMNHIQMTTATTALEGKRSILGAYTSGRNDGAPGMHPGHTPYMNLDDWAPGMTMGTPSKLYENSYPANFKSTWPMGESYFNTRYVWAHNEFTPQQTMRGKMALYGYLYSLYTTAKDIGENTTIPYYPGSSQATMQVWQHQIFLPHAGTYSIRLLNSKGQLQWSRQISLSHGQSVALPPLQQGVYFVQAHNPATGFRQHFSLVY